MNRTSLNRMRERFLARMQDFGDFRDKAGNYWEWERAYKDDLLQLFDATITPDLFPPEPDAATAAEAIKAMNRVLTKPLHFFGSPQNLITWRNFLFLQKQTPEEQLSFVRGFGELLYGSGGSPQRVERFNHLLWPIVQRVHGGNPYATTRIFPTFFLMLQHPKEELVVQTEVMNSASQELCGKRLLRADVLDAEQYHAIRDLTRELFGEFQSWGWQPRDMIDVQSFLWVVTRSDSDYPDSGAGVSS